MYNEKLEALITAALADGVLTEKEKQILFKKAEAIGIDLDEFEMVLDARLVELKKKEAKANQQYQLEMEKQNQLNLPHQSLRNMVMYASAQLVVLSFLPWLQNVQNVDMSSRMWKPIHPLDC